MLPIVDIPTIQYIVEEAVKSGIEEILIITNGSKHSMENHFDVNFELETRLRMSGKDKDADAISVPCTNVFFFNLFFINLFYPFLFQESY